MWLFFISRKIIGFLKIEDFFSEKMRIFWHDIPFPIFIFLILVKVCTEQRLVPLLQTRPFF